VRLAALSSAREVASRRAAAIRGGRLQSGAVEKSDSEICLGAVERLIRRPFNLLKNDPCGLKFRVARLGSDSATPSSY
jgi:hypothetical protein